MPAAGDLMEIPWARAVAAQSVRERMDFMVKAGLLVSEEIFEWDVNME